MGGNATIRKLALLIPLICGCSLLQPASEGLITFPLDGYQVTCHWEQSLIGEEPEPELDSTEASFCRARAREAVGTLLTRVPGATVELVTIESDGSAEVCYQSEPAAQCPPVLGPIVSG
jgi:hypothetical protein